MKKGQRALMLLVAVVLLPILDGQAAYARQEVIHIGEAEGYWELRLGEELRVDRVMDIVPLTVTAGRYAAATPAYSRKENEAEFRSLTHLP